MRQTEQTGIIASLMNEYQNVFLDLAHCLCQPPLLASSKIFSFLSINSKHHSKTDQKAVKP